MHHEPAEVGFIAGFDSRGDILNWKHGGNSCDRGAFQEAPAAYLRPGFGVVISHNSSSLNLRPCMARVVCFLDHVLNLDLRGIERVVVDQPGFGIIKFERDFVQLETAVR